MDTVVRPGWLLLVISLPGRRATPRMRIWRALKTAGAAVLRDGVYLLPSAPMAQSTFAQQAREVMRTGGSAHVLTLESVDQEQDKNFRALFDRSGDYARLIAAARRLAAGLKRTRQAAGARRLKQLRRAYDAVRVTDYFSGPAAEQASQILAETESALTARGSPGEPRAQAGPIPRRNIKDYRNRTWATRARPWVDRLASAWLIKRFIDPKARIVWLKNPQKRPSQALGFDFDGAVFSHVGARVTFEVLLAGFGLENDRGLVRLGELVHYLDVGGVPVAEARGLEMILHGARARHRDDDRLLAESAKILDDLYTAYSTEE